MQRDFIPKEISWLSFNARVLQEANDPTVPLINRIKFLGIYSSNLDEFYEVRVATLKRLVSLGKKGTKIIGHDPSIVLAEIQKIVLSLHKKYDEIYRNILTELEKRNIFFLRENELLPEHMDFVQNYFVTRVRPKIFPVVLHTRTSLLELKDRSIYLVVKMTKASDRPEQKYAIIEVPTYTLPRFLILPGVRKKQYVMFIDDVIRYGLKQIFATTGYDNFEAYDIKLTRDAELDIEDDINVSYLSKINKGLKKRKQGNPVRLGYDESMPNEMLSFILRKLKLKPHDTILPGGRYHNFKDFMKFPDIINEKHNLYPDPVPSRPLDASVSILETIQKRDVLLHFPYNSFDYIIDMLREASIDPKVQRIRITLYRVAENSSIVNALINAVKNGKEVIVLLELQARFDEANNIRMADLLKDEGATVIFGLPGLKVHSKLLLIERADSKNRLTNYCAVATGNFNEDTARLYTDFCILTANQKISDDAFRLFDLFENTYQMHKFR
ncbi:MAG: polyphosphate kinase 1, partial [Spirochaetota bacterium]